MKYPKAPSKKSFLFFALFVLLFAGGALAASNPATLEIGLPNMPKGSTVLNPGEYIRNLFIIGYSLIGFLAVGVIVYAGVLYSIPGKTGKAKEMILGAVSGIVLLFCSYLILNIIDPTLTNIGSTAPPPVQVAPPPEAPSKSDNPIADIPGLKGSVSVNVQYKNSYMLADLKKTVIGNELMTLFKNFNDPTIMITETTENHGCTNLHSGDACPNGGKCCASGCECICNQSQHCSGRAVDIRTSGKDNIYIQAVLEKLYNDPCVDELFNNFVNENGESYCLDNGNPAYQISACSQHDNHIHFSIKTACQSK